MVLGTVSAQRNRMYEYEVRVFQSHFARASVLRTILRVLVHYKPCNTMFVMQ